MKNKYKNNINKDNNNINSNLPKKLKLKSGYSIIETEKLKDVTNKLKSETEKSREKFEIIFNTNPNPTIISSLEEGKIVQINQAFTSLFGFTNEEVQGMKVLSVPFYDNPKDRDRIINELLKQGFCLNLEINYRNKDGEKIIGLYSGRLILLEGTPHIISVILDITIRKKAEEELKKSEEKYRNLFQRATEREKEVMYLSYHDQLTGLYNRRYYVEELNRLNTSSENLPLSVVMADVNGLKLCNDAFGHLAGDKLLKEIASAIKINCRENDIVARIGGDEFVILLPKTDEDEANNILDHLKLYINNRKSGHIHMSISFGLKTKVSVDEDISLILMQAEDNMYRNKVIESDKMKVKTVQLIFKNLYGNYPWEERHSKAVSELCEKLAIALNLDEQDKKDIKTAGLMHDIGKIALSKDILMKPDKLTDSEKLEVMRHSEIGYHILKSTNEYARLASFVMAHHERVDGKGYPKGLKGHEIPYQAKIISIVEAYDTMINKRPYGYAMSEKEAILELKKNVDTQFDKHFTKIFVEKVLLKEWERF